jgi:transcriptional regulator with XRE-family HTH domain
MDAKMAHSRKRTVPSPAVAVGSRIRARREQLGLSAAELAAKAGIDVATYSKLENGRSGSRGPTLSRLVQVAEALKMEPSELLER